MKTYTLALPTHTGSESLGHPPMLYQVPVSEKVTFLCTRQKPRRSLPGMMGRRESAWKDWLLLPAPGIWGTSVRLWQAAPGHAPALLALGSEGRVTGKVAAPLALAASCALPSQMGEVLHSWLRLEDSRPRHGWAFGKPTLVAAKKCQRVLLPSVAERKQPCVRERPLSPEPRKPWYESWQCHW